jgi:hypothetical protein
MVKKILLAVTLMMVVSAGAISAQQLGKSPGALGTCHGTCSLHVTCFGNCFCYKGACVSELPPAAKPAAR